MKKYAQVASQVGYVSYAELGEPTSKILERLVEEGRVKKMVLDGFSFYEKEAARAALDEFRTPPPGYVRVNDLAEEYGLDRRIARDIVASAGLQAVRRSVGGVKSAWYAEEGPLRAALEKRARPPAPSAPAPTPAPAAPTPSPAETILGPSLTVYHDSKALRHARDLICTRLAKAPTLWQDVLRQGGLVPAIAEVARDELLAEGRIGRDADGRLALVIARRPPAPPPPDVDDDEPDLEDLVRKMLARADQARREEHKELVGLLREILAALDERAVVGDQRPRVSNGHAGEPLGAGMDDGSVLGS